MLKNQFSEIGLYEIINKRNDSVVLSGQTKHIAGIKEIKINDFNLSYSVDLLGFHQTNLEIQNKLYNHVLECIDENSNVVNGFSGQGLLSAILSQKAKKEDISPLTSPTRTETRSARWNTRIISAPPAC